MDPKLNELLKWGIENSASSNGDGPEAPAPENRGLNAEILAQIMGGPSDADLMKEAMSVITNPDPEVTLENKLIAFDNLEQLVETIENAKNLEPLALWTPTARPP